MLVILQRVTRNYGKLLSLQLAQRPQLALWLPLPLWLFTTAVDTAAGLFNQSGLIFWFLKIKLLRFTIGFQI
jgi:hypothetical protein